MRLRRRRTIRPGLVALVATAIGCAPEARVAPAPAHAGVVWQYEVRAGGESLEDLAIEARFAPGSEAFRVADEATRFVRDVEYAVGANWQAASAHGSEWWLPCRATECRVRYHFGLRQAASALNDIDTAISSGDVTVAPPSTWLLRRTGGGPAGRLRFHVSSDPPTRFAAGTHPSADGAADTFEASTDAIDASSFAVFGPFHDAVIHSGSARVEIAIAPHALALGDTDVVAWVRAAVDAIAAYFGRFPAPRTLVVVLEGAGGPTRGETLGDGGPAVLVRVGEGVTAATTGDDWVVTHELLHVSLPMLSPDHAWLDEGIASYVEPIARARAGMISPEKVWGDLVEGLPQGLPEPGDEGLERTHTWGRTYWGGALFCLMADVTLRERTGNARSLDDVLRAVVATGADVETHWDIGRWLDEGDHATGTRVLHELYRDMALAPGTVDLALLWSRLGVHAGNPGVGFDDRAPLASLRRAITQEAPDR
jgi:hypothetical protein